MASNLHAAAQQARKLKASPELFSRLRDQVQKGRETTSRKTTRYRILEAPGCRRIVLTDEVRRNSLDSRTAESLQWKLMSWEHNYMVKAVMLQGQPSLKTFSSGWDSSCDNPLAAFARYQQLAYLLATVKKPTISWFNGKVLGAGLGLGLTRFRISSPSSSFEVNGPEQGWGLDGGLSFVLPRLKAGSLAFARYLSLTGARVSGLDMIALGLSTHFMTDGMASHIHQRLGDLAYEPDDLVEDVVGDHSSMYYKLDPVLNPQHKYFQDLAAAWEKHDVERARMRAEDVDGGISGRPILLDDEQEDDPLRMVEEEEEEKAKAEEDNRKTWEDYGKEMADSMIEDESIDQQEEGREMLQAAGCSDEVEDSHVPDYPLPLSLIEDEDEALNNRLAAEQHYESIWWHQNFVQTKEAIWRAHSDAIESQLKSTDAMEKLQSIAEVLSKFDRVDDSFPHYISYPERTRLVDSDRVLLSPWDCTVDRAERFPDFMALMDRVNKCFKGESIEGIVENLKKDGSSWAQECLSRMDQRCPGSLKIVFKQLEQGSDFEIEDCFLMDYRVGHHILSASSDEKKALGLLTSSSSNGEGALHALQSIPDEQVSRLFDKLPEDQELTLPEKNREGQRKRDKTISKRFQRSTTSGRIY